MPTEFWKIERCEDNMKMELREEICEYVKWTELGQDRALAVLNLRVAIHGTTHWKAGIPRLSRKVSLEPLRVHIRTDFVAVL
jgi:hypothetical protein